MTKPDGFNPMRWDCERDGCFNVKRRPKIEVFADCFPRRINFGDVDGMVEINGCFALLEWKGAGGALRRGQIMAYERLTRAVGNSVFVVHGDAETMHVQSYSVFWQGRMAETVESDIEGLKDRIRAWVQWTEKRP